MPVATPDATMVSTRLLDALAGTPGASP